MKTKFECTRDGLVIRGHAYACAGARDAVVLCHGFLANEKTLNTYARCLSENGFLAVTFDFCGGGLGVKSGGRSENMTIMTEQKDLATVLEAVTERFSPRSLSLMGLSQGGLVCALTAARLGAERIRSLVLFYPALCIPDDARKGKMLFYRFDPADVPDVLGYVPMKLGGEYARCVLDMDVYEAIRGYEGPVLLVHGTRDDVVEIRYARRAAAEYTECTYIEVEGGGHGFAGQRDEQAKAELLNFIRKNTEKTGEWDGYEAE